MGVGFSRTRITLVALIAFGLAAASVAAKESPYVHFQKTRTTPFWWETRFPTVEQVNADTADGNISVQSTVRAAAFVELAGTLQGYMNKEGAGYVPFPQVRGQWSAYSNAAASAALSGCRPSLFNCRQSTYAEEERLDGDPEFKKLVVALYLGTPPEQARARNDLQQTKQRLGREFFFTGIRTFLTQIASTIAGLAVPVGVPLAVFAWFMWLGRKPRRAPPPPVSTTFGSASWMPVQQQPSSPRALAGGVMFGKASLPTMPPIFPGAPVVSRPESHTLIVARTRAGKGARVIVPTLLRYAGSMLVIDPKGENAAITARARRDQLGQTVHIVNPWGEMTALYEGLGFPAATFNPLDAIVRDDPNAVAIAQSLAGIICPVSSAKDKYWQGSAANVLTGVFLWLADQPGETKTLARARELVTQSRKDFTEVLIRMASSEGFGGAIREMVSQYIDLASETYSGIMSNLAENTKFLSDPRIKAATATSSFSMQAFREEATTVYLVIPHDRIQTHAAWLRLVIASAMQGLKSHTRAGAPRHRCMFLIDEFGSIGRIDDVPRDIALMSGYGLDFTLIVQGLDQLKDHYGEARGTILSNCAYKWFCHVNDLDTAKYLSESLGKATVRTVGTSESETHSARSATTGQGTTTGEGTTYGETGRPLLTPDEILNLGRDAAILLNPLGAPAYLRPVDYWRLADTFAHLRGTYPQFYWEPPLAYDQNPYLKKD